VRFQGPKISSDDVLEDSAYQAAMLEGIRPYIEFNDLFDALLADYLIPTKP